MLFLIWHVVGSWGKYGWGIIHIGSRATTQVSRTSHWNSKLLRCWVYESFYLYIAQHPLFHPIWDFLLTSHLTQQSPLQVWVIVFNRLCFPSNGSFFFQIYLLLLVLTCSTSNETRQLNTFDQKDFHTRSRSNPCQTIDYDSTKSRGKSEGSSILGLEQHHILTQNPKTLVL